MTKFIGIMILIVFIMYGLKPLGILLNWLFPNTKLGDAFIAWSLILRNIFIQFELDGLLQQIVFYALLAAVLLGLGFTISKKTENKLWFIVSAILTFIAIVTGNIL